MVTYSDAAQAQLDALKRKLDHLPEWLSVAQIEATGLCSGKTVRAAIADPNQPLTAIKVGKRRPGAIKDTRLVRIAKADLAAWLEPVGGAR